MRGVPDSIIEEFVARLSRLLKKKLVVRNDTKNLKWKGNDEKPD